MESEALLTVYSIDWVWPVALCTRPICLWNSDWASLSNRSKSRGLILVFTYHHSLWVTFLFFNFVSLSITCCHSNQSLFLLIDVFPNLSTDIVTVAILLVIPITIQKIIQMPNVTMESSKWRIWFNLFPELSTAAKSVWVSSLQPRET